jgi:hypothetical protein
MVGGDDVWHAGVSKTHWQPARSVAHARGGGVAVYGSPESLGYRGPRQFAMYEGVNRRAGGTVICDCRSQEPHCTALGAPLYERPSCKRVSASVRFQARCCGHRELPCCGGGEAMGRRG